MRNTRSTLREKARSSVYHGYHARGRNNQNLWLVYSVKTDRDWVLFSDRQLIYWICHLETNPDVLSYDLDPQPISLIVREKRFEVRLGAIVCLKNKATEWHILNGEWMTEPDQINALQAAATEAQVTYRFIFEEDLKRAIGTAMRWLKVISYAASIRGRVYSQTEASLWTIVQTKKGGLVEDFLTSLIGEEEAVVIAVLARLSINGRLHLDLAKNGYGRRTPWHLTTQV